MSRFTGHKRRLYMKKQWTSAAMMLVILIGLLLVPIRMGTRANAHIPVIGAAEQLSESYCEDVLTKATRAYIAAKLIDKTISTLQRIEFSFTPFGMGVSIAPGEMLAAVNDAIERVSSAIFSVMGIMLVEKLLLGMISWTCFKALLPLALLCGIVHCLLGKRASWSRPAAGFLASTALLCWLFLPLTALVSGYVEKAYLNTVYEEQMTKVDNATTRMQALEDAMKTSAPDVSQEQPEEQGWFAGLREKLNAISIDNLKKKAEATVKSLKEKAVDLLNYADDATDRLFHTFCIFVLTTIIIPLFSFFLLYRLLKLLLQRFMGELPPGGQVLLAPLPSLSPSPYPADCRAGQEQPARPPHADAYSRPSDALPEPQHLAKRPF